MTVTANPTHTGSAPRTPRSQARMAAIAAVAAVTVAAGIGIGVAASGGGSAAQTSYSYYQSVMGHYGLGNGSMMGGSGYASMMGGSGYAWMMGRSGYAWMMGTNSAPGWMTGTALPGFMMGSSSDPGQAMGRLFANAPGPRVSALEATTLANQVPAGASMDRSANRITFTGTSVRFAVVAGPVGGPDETFRIAGLVNPTVVVPPGAQVSIRLVNADPDTAHGLVITASGAASSWMPMMTAPPAFAGAAMWFLGDPTSAGMHTGTLTLKVGVPGTYQYLCPLPGHAQKGMAGTLMVT